MTTFGKVLVYLNTVLSLLLAAWALGIYTQRVNWTNKAAGESRPPQLTKRTEQIKQLLEGLHGSKVKDDKEKAAVNAALTPYRTLSGEKLRDEESAGGAENHWRVAFADVSQAERYRWAMQQWYGDQLQKLEKGAAPVQTLVYNNGLLAFDKDGRPQLAAYTISAGQQPILPREALRQKEKETQQGVDEEMATVGKRIKEEQQLTEQLAGATGNGGLRGALAYEQLKAKRIDEERAELKPQLINTAVESELLLARQRQLDDRIKELKTTAQ